MRAPVSLSVEFVLSVMLTLSKVVSAACILLTTPRPPKTCKAPLVVEEASVSFSILPVPPTNRFSPIPTPPVTIRAPAFLAPDVVLLVTLVIPSNSAVEPNRAPETPTPPATLRAPVVFDEVAVVSAMDTFEVTNTLPTTCNSAEGVTVLIPI